MKIQHVVFFKFPSVGEEGEKAMAEVASKFGSLEGIECSLSKFFTPFCGYTHCLFVVAETREALKAYLHSEVHLKTWMDAGKTYDCRGLVVFDSELAEDVGPIVSISLVKLDDGINTEDLDKIARPHLGADFLKDVDWPDKTNGYTHCLVKSFPARELLGAYLTSDERKKIFGLFADSDDAMVTCNTCLGTVYKANI